MKSAVIPQVRVEPQLRAELDAVLGENETLSEFVEGAVRRAVEFRRVEAEFHARGEASWQAYLQHGKSKSAEQVFAGLQQKIDAKRKQLMKKG